MHLSNAHAGVSRLLLDRDAQVNMQDNDRMVCLDAWHPMRGTLMWLNCYWIMMHKLTCKSMVGWTVLMLASNDGHAEVTKLILDHDAQVKMYQDNLWMDRLHACIL